MTIVSIDGQAAVCLWIEKNRTYREECEFVLLGKYTP